MNGSGSKDAGYTQSCVATAEKDQQTFGNRTVNAPVEPCPGGVQSHEQVVLIPRKAANIFEEDKSVKKLLPDRYPPKGNFIKEIEYNFYPDLNTKRTITALVTEVSWAPEAERRPTPRAGIPVYFSLGGTAHAKLSANQATSDSEGCASVEVTVKTLHSDKAMLEAASTIEVFASLEPSCQSGSPSVKLTIHRNENVDAKLVPAERPENFAVTLEPVLNLSTWIVRQKEKLVTSNGAKAVQQLLNQVACRKRNGGHQFLKPDGQFGPGSESEAKRFIQDFSGRAAAGTSAVAAFVGHQFGVSVEEDDKTGQGVKSYIRAEYGSYAEGIVIDAHLLVGKERWVPGAGSNVMAADGLLDIYTAVVWEFLETMRVRADEYCDAPATWYRHPNDDAIGLEIELDGTKTKEWPDTVSQGVAYWYGGARSLEDFLRDLGGNFARPPAPPESWYQYLNNNNCRIGLHGGVNRVDIPTNLYDQFTHLNEDPDITNTAPPNKPPHYVLNHPRIDRVLKQYTGIDCSGFCQRVSIEAKFRPEHCSDLANERICRALPIITHEDGLAQHKLCTRIDEPDNPIVGWPSYYKLMEERPWRKQVVFRGDLLNVPGSHIVVLETADRSVLTKAAPSLGDLWIYQAHGLTTVNAQVYLQNIWRPTECIRRVVYSPFAEWGIMNSWTSNSAALHFGRIPLWD